MLFFFTCLIALYVLISILIAVTAEVLGDFLITLAIAVVAIVLIFHYLA